MADQCFYERHTQPLWQSGPTQWPILSAALTQWEMDTLQDQRKQWYKMVKGHEISFTLSLGGVAVYAFGGYR